MILIYLEGATGVVAAAAASREAFLCQAIKEHAS